MAMLWPLQMAITDGHYRCTQWHWRQQCNISWLLYFACNLYKYTHITDNTVCQRMMRGTGAVGGGGGGGPSTNRKHRTPSTQCCLATAGPWTPETAEMKMSNKISPWHVVLNYLNIVSNFSSTHSWLIIYSDDDLLTDPRAPPLSHISLALFSHWVSSFINTYTLKWAQPQASTLILAHSGLHVPSWNISRWVINSATIVFSIFRAGLDFDYSKNWPHFIMSAVQTFEHSRMWIRA